MRLNTDKMIAELEDGIGWVIFNNPAKRNAISLEMWEALGVIITEYQHDENVRVVVLKGAGDKAFVSGADISEFEEKRGSSASKGEYDQKAADAQAVGRGRYGGSYDVQGDAPARYRFSIQR